MSKDGSSSVKHSNMMVLASNLDMDAKPSQVVDGAHGSDTLFSVHHSRFEGPEDLQPRDIDRFLRSACKFISYLASMPPICPIDHAPHKEVSVVRDVRLNRGIGLFRQSPLLV